MKKVKLNKRDIVVLIVVACIVVFVVGRYVVYKNIEAYKFATQMEKVAIKNEDAIFTVDKIVLYSSASAIDNSEGQTMQDLNVCQYTDIAIYIDNKSYINDLTEENTVKELYIDNINIQSATSKGEKSLKYKSPLSFGKFKVVNENIEQEQNSKENVQEQKQDNNEEQNTETTNDDRINFEIIYTNEDNEKSDYINPTFYTDCSNPITLNYMNENIVTGYAVSTEDTQIKFDGNILQSVGVNLQDIACNVSFDVHIKNNLDEEFVCGVGVDIPLESGDRTIYNGYMYGMQNNLKNLYTFFKK